MVRNKFWQFRYSFFKKKKNSFRRETMRKFRYFLKNRSDPRVKLFFSNKIKNSDVFYSSITKTPKPWAGKLGYQARKLYPNKLVLFPHLNELRRFKTYSKDLIFFKNKGVLGLDSLYVDTGSINSEQDVYTQIRELHRRFISKKFKTKKSFKQRLLFDQHKSVFSLTNVPRLPTLQKCTQVFVRMSLHVSDEETNSLHNKHTIIFPMSHAGGRSIPPAFGLKTSNRFFFNKSVFGLQLRNNELLRGTIFKLSGKYKTMLVSNLKHIDKIRYLYVRQTSKKKTNEARRKFRQYRLNRNRFGRVKLFEKRGGSLPGIFRGRSELRWLWANYKVSVVKLKLRDRRAWKRIKLKYRKRMRRRFIRKRRVRRKMKRRRKTICLGRRKKTSFLWVYRRWKRANSKLRSFRNSTPYKASSVLTRLNSIRSLLRNINILSRARLVCSDSQEIRSACEELNRLVEKVLLIIGLLDEDRPLSDIRRLWIKHIKEFKIINLFFKKKKIIRSFKAAHVLTRLKKVKRLKRLNFFFKKKYKVAVRTVYCRSSQSSFGFTHLVHKGQSTNNTFGYLQKFKKKPWFSEEPIDDDVDMDVSAAQAPKTWYTLKNLSSSLVATKVRSTHFVRTLQRLLACKQGLSKNKSQVRFLAPKQSRNYLKRRLSLPSISKKSLGFVRRRSTVPIVSKERVRQVPPVLAFFNKVKRLTQTTGCISDKGAFVKKKNYNPNVDFILNNVKLAKKRLLLRVFKNFKVGTEYTQIMQKIKYAFRRIPRRMRKFIKRTNFILTIFYLITFKEIHVWTNFLQNLFYKYTYKKHRIVFYTIRRLIKLISQNVLRYVMLDGIYFQLKGKITGKGGTRKKTLRHSSGVFSASTHEHVFKYKFKQVWSKSGAIGLKTIIVHGI